MSSFSSSLAYQFAGVFERGRAVYETSRPFTYFVGENGDKGSTFRCDVPAGFRTDLASIPWFLHWWLPPDGRYVQAAVLHDWLYSGVFVQRKMADEILAEAAAVPVAGQPGATPLQRFAIYCGVRVGGWRAYGRYRKAKRRAT